MVQQLRPLATLPEDPVLVPNTLILQLTITCNSSSKRGLGYMHSMCKHTHLHIKNFFNFEDNCTIDSTYNKCS